MSISSEEETSLQAVSTATSATILKSEDSESDSDSSSDEEFEECILIGKFKHLSAMDKFELRACRTHLLELPKILSNIPVKGGNTWTKYLQVLAEYKKKMHAMRRQLKARKLKKCNDYKQLSVIKKFLTKLGNKFACTQDVPGAGGVVYACFTSSAMREMIGEDTVDEIKQQINTFKGVGFLSGYI